MEDYKKTDWELFHAATKAIESLEKAQIKTEEMYLSAAEPVLSILRLETGGAEKKGKTD